MMQKAGLVFPDVLLPRALEQAPVPPPRGRTWNGNQCIEDLATNPTSERFLFRHAPHNAQATELAPHDVFPATDALRTLLTDMIWAMGGANLTQVITLSDTTVFSPKDPKKIVR
jgi:hypothetical protein